MKNKLFSALLSVVVAFGLWLYVITAVSPGSTETYSDIPVTWGNESVLNEKGMMIVHKSSDVVTLRLSGNRSDLSKVNRSNITVKADLSTINEPGDMIALNYTQTFPGNVPSNAFVIETKTPGTLHVSVAWRVTKEVPVEVRWIGSAPDGFITDRENRVLDFPSVTVSGPDFVVNQIEKAVIDVDLAEQRESISADYNYTLCNGEGEPVDAQLITTNAEQIHLEARIQRVKDIQLVCTVVEGAGATVSHVQLTKSLESIRVSGSETALELLGDTLTLGVINLADVNKSASIVFEILLPEGVNNLTGVNEVTVEVQLNGLATKEFTVEEIGSVHIPEGMAAEIITEKMTVAVRGPAADISNLTAQDLTVAVDFTGAEVGTSTYKATVSFADGFQSLGVLRADPISASVQARG